MRRWLRSVRECFAAIGTYPAWGGPLDGMRLSREFHGHLAYQLSDGRWDSCVVVLWTHQSHLLDRYIRNDRTRRFEYLPPRRIAPLPYLGFADEESL